MFNRAHFLGKYVLVSISSLLMLTVFDSNSWWKVLLYAIPATLLSLYLLGLSIRTDLSPLPTAVMQGLALTFFAYLCGLTPFFRTTWGTLFGYALLLILAERIVSRFFLPPA